MKPLDAIAGPGMYLVYKYNQFKRQQQENSRRKVTEKELQTLNHKIDKLLAKLDEHDADGKKLSQEEECVVCLCAKATMQTFPCGHKVVCRKCFVKTIQVAVSQRCLPLKCVVCRTRVLKLKQSGEEDISPPAPRRASSSPGRQSSGSRLFARLFSSKSNQQAARPQVSTDTSTVSTEIQPASPRTNNKRTEKHHHKNGAAASFPRQTQSVAPAKQSVVVSNKQSVVSTKLMQPWLIYPSLSSPKQQRAFGGNSVQDDVVLRVHGPSSGPCTPKDIHKAYTSLRTSGPFSPAQRRPSHQCSPALSSRISELKHAHMLSPRVPRCTQCVQQQRAISSPIRVRTHVAD